MGNRYLIRTNKSNYFEFSKREYIQSIKDHRRKVMMVKKMHEIWFKLVTKRRIKLFPSVGLTQGTDHPEIEGSQFPRYKNSCQQHKIYSNFILSKRCGTKYFFEYYFRKNILTLRYHQGKSGEMVGVLSGYWCKNSSNQYQRRWIWKRITK